MAISSFSGRYSFLSNFHECKVVIDDLIFDSSEAAFQSFKNDAMQLKFVGLSAKESKKLGKTVKKRCDWDAIKDVVMYGVVKEKFMQHEDLKEKLLATGDEELIEGNTWWDTYWGVCQGHGDNKLGKTLMRVRDELSRGIYDLFIEDEECD